MHSHPMILIALAAFALASVCPAALADAAAPAPKLPDDWQVIKPIVSDDMPTGEGLFGMDLNADGSRVVLCEKRYLANEWAVIVYYWPWYTVILGGVLWLLLLVLFLRFNRRARRLAQDGCPACGYPAFDGRGDTCPECGAPVNRREPQWRRTLRNAVGLAMIGMLVGVPIPTVLLLIDAPRQGSASAWFDWPSKQAVAWIKEYELEELEPLIEERHCIVFREVAPGYPERGAFALGQAKEWRVIVCDQWVVALGVEWEWTDAGDGLSSGRASLRELIAYDSDGRRIGATPITPDDSYSTPVSYDPSLQRLYVGRYECFDFTTGKASQVNLPDGFVKAIPGTEQFVIRNVALFGLARSDGSFVRQLDLAGHRPGWLFNIAFSDDSQRLYMACRTKTRGIFVWDLERGYLPDHTIETPERQELWTPFSIRGREALLVLTRDPRRVLVYDLRDTNWLGELDCTGMSDAFVIQLSADASRVLLSDCSFTNSSNGPNVRVFDLNHFPALAARGAK